jgi:hypothetical protein
MGNELIIIDEGHTFLLYGVRFDDGWVIDEFRLLRKFFLFLVQLVEIIEVLHFNNFSLVKLALSKGVTIVLNLYYG